ncbi:hypothetical protein AHAS_Ahas06G0248100 [Arachis hypogaea]
MPKNPNPTSKTTRPSFQNDVASVTSPLADVAVNETEGCIRSGPKIRFGLEMLLQILNWFRSVKVTALLLLLFSSALLRLFFPCSFSSRRWCSFGEEGQHGRMKLETESLKDVKCNDGKEKEKGQRALPRKPRNPDPDPVDSDVEKLKLNYAESNRFELVRFVLTAGNFGVIFTASWLFIDTFLVSEDDEIVSDPLMLFFIGQGMIMECHIPCAFIANGKHISFLSPFHATIKSSYKNLLPKVLFKVLIGKVEQKINLLLLQC